VFLRALLDLDLYLLYGGDLDLDLDLKLPLGGEWYNILPGDLE